MWRKISPFILAILLISTGYLGLQYFNNEVEITNRDRQIVSLMQASCDIETLMDNDSVKSYLVQVLGDSAFAQEVTDVKVDTFWKDSIVYTTEYIDNIVYRDRVRIDTVWRDRYFQAKVKPSFAGTIEEFNMYKDSMEIYRGALFSLHDRFDSVMYKQGIIQSEKETAERNLLLLDTELNDAMIQLDSMKLKALDYEAQRDSFEQTLLNLFNSKKYRREARKNRRQKDKSGSPITMGAYLGAGLGLTLHDGETVLGPNMGIGVGLVSSGR